MPYGHDETTGYYAAAVAPIAVGNVSSQQWSKIYQSGIGTINLACLVVGKESSNEIKHEESPHAVVREALRHLGDEEQIETFRVLHQCLCIDFVVITVFLSDFQE